MVCLLLLRLLYLVSFVLRARHSFCFLFFRARARDFYRAILEATVDYALLHAYPHPSVTSCTQPVQQQIDGHGAAFARVPRRYPMASLARSSFLVFFLLLFLFFVLEHCVFFSTFSRVDPILLSWSTAHPRERATLECACLVVLAMVPSSSSCPPWRCRMAQVEVKQQYTRLGSRPSLRLPAAEK